MYVLLLQVACPEQDVVVITALRNLCLSWTNLPASVTVMFRWSLMSCAHLLFALLPGTIPSIMIFSKLSWRLIWPKYCSFLERTMLFSQFIFTFSSFSMAALVTFLIHGILRIFL